MFGQKAARELASLDELLLICGRYEGVDERVAEHLADEEISIGDYVLSGGELGAAIVVDAVARLLPGVLGNEDSSRNESFSEEMRDCWIARNIRGRRSFAAGKCRTCCWAGITRKSGSGAERRREPKHERLRPDLCPPGD